MMTVFHLLRRLISSFCREGWYHPSSAEKCDSDKKKKKKKKKKNTNSIGCFTFKFSNHDMPLYRSWSSQLVFCRKWWPFSIYWEGWYHPSAEKADIILLLPRNVTPIKKKKKNTNSKQRLTSIWTENSPKLIFFPSIFLITDMIEWGFFFFFFLANKPNPTKSFKYWLNKTRSGME